MATNHAEPADEAQPLPHPSDARAFTDIDGVGPKTAETVQDLGFETFDHAVQAYIHEPETIVGRLPTRFRKILLRDLVEEAEYVGAHVAGMSPPAVATMAFIRRFGANRMALKDEYRPLKADYEYVHEDLGEGVRRDVVTPEHLDCGGIDTQYVMVADPKNVMGVSPACDTPGEVHKLTSAESFDMVYDDDTYGTLTSDQGVEMCFDVELLMSLCDFAGVAFDPTDDDVEDEVEKIQMADKAELDAVDMEIYPAVIPIPSANAQVALAPKLKD